MTDAVAGTRAEHDDAIVHDAIGSSSGCDRDPSDMRRMADRFTDVGVGGKVAAAWVSGLPRDGSPSASPAPLWFGAAQRPLT